MKKFRNIRNKKKRIPSKYLLAILSTVCVLALFISLVFNINGGPLNMVAGYVFVPMQKGINGAGAWLSGKANDFKTLGEVLEENKDIESTSKMFETEPHRLLVGDTDDGKKIKEDIQVLTHLLESYKKGKKELF